MLAAILVVVALLCGFSVATTVYIDQQGTAGLRSELALRAGADLALRASLERAEDAQTQDDEVRAAIERTFAPTGIAFDVTRSLDAEAYFEVPTQELAGAAQAMTIPELAERAEFVSGGIPESPDEVAVQEVAAEKLGLEVGDEVILNKVAFTVSGLWHALDALDPRWYGDETVSTGGGERLGPFALDEAAWARFESPPSAIWTIVPRSIDEFTATNRGSVDAAWRGVDQTWRGEVTGHETLVTQRRLARTLDEFALRIEGLRAIEPVAAVLVAGSALVVLSQLVQLLVATRERESALFWARGRSPGAIARRTAVEVGVSAVIGAGLGVGAVALALSLTADVHQLDAVRSTAIIVPAVVVVGAIAFAGIASYRSVVSATTATKGGRGGARVRRVAVPGVVILVTIAAALAVWQLRLYGSPLTPNAGGSSSIDPIAVIAPAAALIAVVLAALAAFPWVVALYSRRATTVGAHLTARTLARQTGRVAAPLVVVALAVGSATVASTFSATWNQLFTQTADLHAGSALRIASRFDPLSSTQLDAIAATEGVTAVAPLDVQVLTVGTLTGTMLAAAPDALAQLATTAGGSFSPPDGAEALRLEQPGPVIPAGTTELTLRVEAVGLPEAPRMSAWFADSLGRLSESPFGEPTAEPEGVLVYTAAIDEPGVLLSLDLRMAPQIFEMGDPDATFRLLELTAEVDGAAQDLPLDQFWVADSLRGQLAPPRMMPDGSGFSVGWPLPFIRMTASFDGTVMDSVRPGALVTARLATLLELSEGDVIAFPVRDGVERVTAEVAAIVPAIPGARTDLAVMIDLAVVNHLHLRADQQRLELTDAWVATSEPQQVRDALRPILPANTRIDSSVDPVGRQVLGAASVALWAAALCCLLIALVAVASSSRSRVQWGRNDIASLRAVGVSPGEQAAVVVRELGIVLAVAAVGGALAGVLVSLLTVPELARAAVDRAYLALEFSLLVDWLGLAVLLGALAAGIALLLLDLARRIRTLASTALPSEGHE